MGLEQKARLFEQRIENRHVRHGLVSDSRLSEPGKVETSRRILNDNDGLWTVDYFQTEEGRYEAALRSLQILAFYKTAAVVTGEEKYEEAYRERVTRGYARRILEYGWWPGGGEINHSDDELAYPSFDPLLRYERDATLKELYQEALRFVWGEVLPERNPLWNFISAARGGGHMTEPIRVDSMRALERIPLDMVEWNVRNSHRRDLILQAGKDRFGRLQTVKVLPPDERPVGKWNVNPHVPDGGSAGYVEDDAAYFLLPYWMRRYHGWIQE